MVGKRLKHHLSKIGRAIKFSAIGRQARSYFRPSQSELLRLRKRQHRFSEKQYELLRKKAGIRHEVPISALKKSRIINASLAARIALDSIGISGRSPIRKEIIAKIKKWYGHMYDLSLNPSTTERAKRQVDQEWESIFDYLRTNIELVAAEDFKLKFNSTLHKIANGHHIVIQAKPRKRPEVE